MLSYSQEGINVWRWSMALNGYSDVSEFWSWLQEPFGFIHSIPVTQSLVGYERNLPVFGNPRKILKSGKKIPWSLFWAALPFKALLASLSGMQYKHHCQMVRDRNRSIQEPEWGLRGSLLMTTVLWMTLKRMQEMTRRGPLRATRNHLAGCYSTDIISLITTVKYSVVLETQKSSFRCSENRTVETSESQSWAFCDPLVA